MENREMRYVILYDNRLNNFGGTINSYKDVYVELESNGKNVSYSQIKHIEDNKDLGIDDKRLRVIINMSKKLVRDTNSNLYTIDFKNRKVMKGSVD